MFWWCCDIITVKKAGRAEITEKKSRFIASVFPVQSKEEADTLLNKVRKEFWDATHNVYAYRIEGNINRFSDDGEPQGTSGFPVFNVLEGKNISNVLVVVTRYFGGILLGKGGLVRAYTKAAQVGLESAEVIEIKKMIKYELICDYGQKDKVLYFLEKNQIKITTEFYEDVKIFIEIPFDKKENFEEEIEKLSNGQFIMNILS